MRALERSQEKNMAQMKLGWGKAKMKSYFSEAVSCPSQHRDKELYIYVTDLRVTHLFHSFQTLQHSSWCYQRWRDLLYGPQVAKLLQFHARKYCAHLRESKYHLCPYLNFKQINMYFPILKQPSFLPNPLLCVWSKSVAYSSAQLLNSLSYHLKFISIISYFIYILFQYILAWNYMLL